MMRFEVNNTVVIVQPSIIGFFERIAFLSFCTTYRGWRFELFWSHQIVGSVLAVFSLLPSYTLFLLSDPAVFDSRWQLIMKFSLRL